MTLIPLALARRALRRFDYIRAMLLSVIALAALLTGLGLVGLGLFIARAISVLL